MAIKRKYLQYIAQESDKISLKWKALHVFLYTLIAINALCSVYAFNHMFVSFNHRCVLYIKPVFELKKLKYHNIKTLENENSTLENENSTLKIENSTASAIDITPKALVISELDEEIIDTEFIPGLNFKVPKVADVEVRNGRYWVVNKTLTGQVRVDVRKTIFTDVVMCDWVLFVPLASFIIAVFLAVLIMISERGGRGYRSDILRRPWTLLYPCLIICSVQAVCYLIITPIVSDGLGTFCSNFKQYTGEDTCTILMDYFTIQKRFGKRYFYVAYVVCFYSFPIGLLLWVLQITLNLFRILCAADFQLHLISVESKNTTDELTEEAVHQALLKAYPDLAKGVLVYETPQNEEKPKKKRNKLPWGKHKKSVAEG